jgi:hypothetical protein
MSDHFCRIYLIQAENEAKFSTPIFIFFIAGFSGSENSRNNRYAHVCKYLHFNQIKKCPVLNSTATCPKGNTSLY